MGLMTDAFKDIMFLAKEAMDVREDGLPVEDLAGSLLIFDKYIKDIGEALKTAKDRSKESKDMASEVLVERRRNPNTTLDQFAEEEVPKSAGEDKPDATVQSTFDGTTPPEEGAVAAEGEDMEHLDLTGVDPSEGT